MAPKQGAIFFAKQTQCTRLEFLPCRASERHTGSAVALCQWTTSLSGRQLNSFALARYTSTCDFTADTPRFVAEINVQAETAVPALHVLGRGRCTAQ